MKPNEMSRLTEKYPILLKQSGFLILEIDNSLKLNHVVLWLIQIYEANFNQFAVVFLRVSNYYVVFPMHMGISDFYLFALFDEIEDSNWKINIKHHVIDTRYIWIIYIYFNQNRFCPIWMHFFSMIFLRSFSLHLNSR